MRVATWNLERGGSQRARLAQQETLSELGAAVAVLTEPPASYVAGAGVVTSPPRRSGRNGNESWVAIVGDGVEPSPLEVPFEHLAVVAQVTSARSAGRSESRPRQTPARTRARRVGRRLQPIGRTCKRGRVGEGAGCPQPLSRRSRVQCLECGSRSRASAASCHRPDLRPKAMPITEQGRIDPVRDGVTMTDHAGYWVDLAV